MGEGTYAILLVGGNVPKFSEYATLYWATMGWAIIQRLTAV